MTQADKIAIFKKMFGFNPVAGADEKKPEFERAPIDHSVYPARLPNGEIRVGNVSITTLPPKFADPILLI